MLIRSRCLNSCYLKHPPVSRMSSGASLTCVFNGVCPTSPLIHWKTPLSFVMPLLAVCQLLVTMSVISVAPNFLLFQHLDALFVAWEALKDLMHSQDQFLHRLAEVCKSSVCGFCRRLGESPLML